MSDKRTPSAYGIRLLEVLANSRDSLTLDEIAKSIEVPKSTAKALCSVLQEHGYIQYDLNGKSYWPGYRAVSFSKNILTNNVELKLGRQKILTRLSNDIGETCNICLPNGTSMIYFDRVETYWPLTIKLNIDDQVPLHCTSTGKLYLSSLPKATLDQFLSKIKLKPLTLNTITDVDELKAKLKIIRQTGIGVDNEEFMYGMVCVAVPIIRNDGGFFGALSMHAPSSRMSYEKALQQASRLKLAAKELVELPNM